MKCPLCGEVLEITRLNDTSIQMERERGSQATHRADCPNNPYCPFSGMLVADTITFRQRIRSRGRTSVAVTIPAEIYDRLLADYGDEVEVTIRAISEG